jgi:hypothetical protein
MMTQSIMDIIQYQLVAVRWRVKKTLSQYCRRRRQRLNIQKRKVSHHCRLCHRQLSRRRRRRRFLSTN